VADERWVVHPIERVANFRRQMAGALAALRRHRAGGAEHGERSNRS
jgi:hypothetical protein